MASSPELISQSPGKSSVPCSEAGIGKLELMAWAGSGPVSLIPKPVPGLLPPPGPGGPDLTSFVSLEPNGNQSREYQRTRSHKESKNVVMAKSSLAEEKAKTTFLISLWLLAILIFPMLAFTTCGANYGIDKSEALPTTHANYRIGDGVLSLPNEESCYIRSFHSRKLKEMEETTLVCVVLDTVDIVVAKAGFEHTEYKDEAAATAAALAISKAISEGSDEQIRRFMEHGCVGKLSELLKSPDPKIVVCCLKGLRNIMNIQITCFVSLEG
ncbi:hypothetical protein RHMOL_Rhmol13G0016100 [Rhododendron molle]|uniref:Uncharacterized protein n=1 Tax=Rhododendron molle TaxID=49168 RepID=A0ACC0L1X0_RHOML|nr:hypothetical protein RHMOL_Rhmol13G0016100 [Rhododendron molle]